MGKVPDEVAHRLADEFLFIGQQFVEVEIVRMTEAHRST